MTNTTAIQALIDAVEAGGVTEWPTLSELGIPADFGDGTPIIRSIMRAYDGSLDAAMALHNAVLPKISQYSIVTDPTCIKVTVAAWPNGLNSEAFITGLGWHEGNPARAWLLAVLRAMLTQK